MPCQAVGTKIIAVATSLTIKLLTTLIGTQLSQVINWFLNTFFIFCAALRVDNDHKDKCWWNERKNITSVSHTLGSMVDTLMS